MDLATLLPDSPVPHLLRTNAPLPEHLGAQVKATFTLVQADIAELDVRISRLSVVLDRLVQERGQLYEYLDQHRALFSPARRVPPEIWGEIFQHCLPSDAAVEDLRCTRAIIEDRFSSASSDAAGVVDDGEERRAPWVFTRVSRALRLAALSCPKLWTRVSVCVDDHAVLDRRKLWPLAQVLRLSGTLPLSVTLFGRSYDPNAFEVWTHSPAAQRLAATCHRWEKLQLSHVPCPTVNGFFSALRNRLDTLEVLEMHFTSELPRTKPLACDVFANTPRLRALTVTGAAFPYDALHLPMRQLASCSMHSVLYFSRLVQSCPDLVHLNLTLPPPGVRVESFGVLRCERVRSLRLDLHTSDHVLTDQLLKSLVLPLLTTLHLECHHLPDDGVAKFFKKNNTITHLTFRVDKWSEESLLRSLRSLPLLEHLCVSIWPGSMKDTERLLNNLARRGRSVEPLCPMLPRLQEIELVCRAADFPVETFVRLVRARWAFGRRGNETEGGVLVAPLKSVNVFLHGSDVADHVSATLSKLKDLKAAGLDIRAYAKGLLMPGFGRRIL
ncbi:hypothetical protein APHAL10511_005223 [Amanita phalloides]|nr:hypothetical protein APHAL10511_005223 [Amanita phalloides]